MPEVDIAAALAVLAQGDEPLLLDPRPSAAQPATTPRRAARARRAPSAAARAHRRPMATYRIAVGKRHRVEPRQIVGALANEGGLRRGDFGRIDIRPDFSLVELPADLSRQTPATRCATTRISGDPDRPQAGRRSPVPQPLIGAPAQARLVRPTHGQEASAQEPLSQGAGCYPCPATAP